MTDLTFGHGVPTDLTFEQHMQLLKGNDNKQWILEGKAYRDKYDGPDELDNEDYIQVMRDY